MKTSSTIMLCTALCLPLAVGTISCGMGGGDCEQCTPNQLSYAVVHTGQTACFGDGAEIQCPAAGEPFYGQDYQNVGYRADLSDNRDGTVTDHVTGLMWQQGFSLVKMTYPEALEYVDTQNKLGMFEYSDWRLPTIKQQYSLIDFKGLDPAPESTDESGLTPFIDADIFDFEYGDTSANERIIDSQWASSTMYAADERLMFGVNFADGRIKGYGIISPDPSLGLKTFNVRLCRGNPDYGKNSFVDNRDETVSDEATGLMWDRSDSGQGMIWQEALAWVQQMNAEKHLGYSDWRMPNAKELQSIVDYSRSPDTTASAAVNPVFRVSEIVNMAGETDYPFFWTSTSHLKATGGAENAVYIAFGRGMGTIDGNLIDIHGAGCQRSDPKTGDPEDFPRSGFGPQGDVQRLLNFVRLVRDGD